MLVINAKGLELSEVADMAGINRSSVYDYCLYGKSPNIVQLEKLCKALNVSADYLLFGKNNNYQKQQQKINELEETMNECIRQMRYIAQN